MKIVHFNTFEGGGGAAKASLSLHRAMIDLGVDSTLVVHRKTTLDNTVLGLPPSRFGVLKKKLMPWILSMVHFVLYRPLEIFSFGLFGNRSIVLHPRVKAADIVSLSWVSWFLDIDSIALLLKQKKPVVWTCYDMWAFTGGCHYSGGCDHYMSHCGRCPQLGKHKGSDITQWLWFKKKKCWDTSMLTVVCPSDWLAQSVRKSGLLAGVRVEVIPTGIDVSIFKPIPKADARNSLGLPLNKRLVLFIATTGLANERKGGPLLEESLHALHQTLKGDVPDVVILGRRQNKTAVHNKFVIHEKEFNDDLSLAQLYAACDVLVAPSKADTLPLTVLQAMACGTPCVAYDTGGMGDVIEHLNNGYLAQAFDVKDFANGIDFVLCDPDRYQFLSKNSLEKIMAGFTSRYEAKQYLKLYDQLLA